MARTGRPMLCAERREPPTAMARQPGRVRVMSKCPISATTISSTNENGMPSTSPMPIRSQVGSLKKLIDMACTYLSSSMSTIARTMISVTSVVKNARSRR